MINPDHKSVRLVSEPAGADMPSDDRDTGAPAQNGIALSPIPANRRNRSAYRGELCNGEIGTFVSGEVERVGGRVDCEDPHFPGDWPLLPWSPDIIGGHCATHVHLSLKDGEATVSTQTHSVGVITEVTALDYRLVPVMPPSQRWSEENSAYCGNVVVMTATPSLQRAGEELSFRTFPSLRTHWVEAVVEEAEEGERSDHTYRSRPLPSTPSLQFPRHLCTSLCLQLHNNKALNLCRAVNPSLEKERTRQRKEVKEETEWVGPHSLVTWLTAHLAHQRQSDRQKMMMTVIRDVAAFHPSIR
ncbi:hypothetical protein Q8A73_008272 [Channa argus]|nr:hypothetical protein Q8A73_008272 [Channa argus]